MRPLSSLCALLAIFSDCWPVVMYCVRVCVGMCVLPPPATVPVFSLGLLYPLQRSSSCESPAQHPAIPSGPGGHICKMRKHFSFSFLFLYLVSQFQNRSTVDGQNSTWPSLCKAALREHPATPAIRSRDVGQCGSVTKWPICVTPCFVL